MRPISFFVTYLFIILPHGEAFDLFGGSKSDKKVPSQEELDLVAASTGTVLPTEKKPVTCNEIMAKAVVVANEEKAVAIEERDMALETSKILSDARDRMEEGMKKAQGEKKELEEKWESFEKGLNEQMAQTVKISEAKVLESQRKASEEIKSITADTDIMIESVKKQAEIDIAKIKREMDKLIKETENEILKTRDLAKVTVEEVRRESNEKVAEVEAKMAQLVDRTEEQINQSRADAENKVMMIEDGTRQELEKVKGDTMREIEKVKAESSAEIQQTKMDAESIVKDIKKQMEDLEVSTNTKIEKIKLKSEREIESHRIMSDETVRKTIEEKESEVKRIESERDDKISQMQNTLETEKKKAEAYVQSEKRKAEEYVQMERKKAKDEVDRTKKSKEEAISEWEKRFTTEKKDSAQKVAKLNEKIARLENEKKKVEGRLAKAIQDHEYWESIHSQQSYCNLTMISQNTKSSLKHATSRASILLSDSYNSTSFKAKSISSDYYTTFLTVSMPYKEKLVDLYDEHAKEFVDEIIIPPIDQYVLPAYEEHVLPLIEIASEKGKIIYKDVTEKADVLKSLVVSEVESKSSLLLKLMKEEGIDTDYPILSDNVKYIEENALYIVESIVQFMILLGLFLLRRKIFRFVLYVVFAPFRMFWFFCPLRLILRPGKKTSKEDQEEEREDGQDVPTVLSSPVKSEFNVTQ